MPDLPEIETNDRDNFSIYPSYAIGSVIGASLGPGGSCQVEVVLLLRHHWRYRVRHLVLDLEHLARIRREVAVTDPAPTWPHTDTDAASLEDAFAIAADIARRSTAEPVPRLRGWRSSIAGESFEDTFTRYRLRSAIDAVPSPPLWQRALRAAGTSLIVIVSLAMFLLGFGAEVFDPWGEKGLGWIDLLLGGLIVVGAIAAVGGIIIVIDEVRERWASRTVTGRHGRVNRGSS
ncbi:hypothetical protein [uncultured Phycicoccus sp.]|uniref:hypothetical protein n=1 Tax=uncultured Phycicoccus sp. TaxID=661422 RepID=UPI00261D4C98|nr:hypothetical protein [uncultured Phycicoccus sp.]